MRTRITDLPASFWWLWLAVLVTWVGRFVIPFLTLFLTTQVGMSSAAAATVVSAYGVGVMASAVAGGYLADRIGRRRTLCGSLLGSVAVLVVIPHFVSGFLPLVGLLCAYGLVNGAAQPAIATLIGDLAPVEHRRAAYSFKTWAVNLGYAIGPLLAGLLAQQNYALLFYGQASVAFVSSLIVFRFVPEPPHADETPTGSSPTVLGDPVFLTFVASMFAYYLVYVQSTTTLPMVMAGQGLSGREYGFLLTLNGLLLCALQIPCLRLTIRLNHSVVLVSFLALTCVGMLLQSQARTLPLYLAAVAAWTLGELGLHPAAQSTAADLAHGTIRGRYQGTYALAFSGATVIAPLIGGTVLDHLGARALWLGCAGVCVAVGAALASAAPSRERRIRQVTVVNSGYDTVAA